MIGSLLTLILAGIVALALIAKRLHVPYPVVFVLGGLVMVCSAFLALLMRAPRYYLDRELWLNLYGVQATGSVLTVR